MHLPHASLDIAYPNWRVKPAVVFAQDRVKLCSPAAAQTGVRVGMRRGGVNTLCPQAESFLYNPAAEQRALDAVALTLLQYTPELALADNNTFLLKVTASLALFNGPRRLGQRIRATMHAQSFGIHLSMAPTAKGAWLLATASRPQARRALKQATLQRRLDTLPCSRLPEAQACLAWLDSIGCVTLGDLRKLPRSGLQRRTHQAMLPALDAAYGLAPETFKWIVPPPAFNHCIQLVERIEHADAIQFVAHRLFEQLCGWLAAHQLAVTRLTLTLQHEHGRQARPPTPLPLTLGAPSWQIDHLLGLLKEHLHHHVLDAPVIAVALHTLETLPRAPASDQLFPQPGSLPVDHLRLLERLTARLGSDCILQPCPMADHRPEVANRWAPLHQKLVPEACIHDANRPFWLLDTPIALSVRQHRPFYGSPLRIIGGPERIEDGWWDGLTIRDYFIAQDQNGTRYWLYQERRRQDGWFLHGLFA